MIGRVGKESPKTQKFIYPGSKFNKKKYLAYLWKRIREKSTVWRVNNLAGKKKKVQRVCLPETNKQKILHKQKAKERNFFKLKIPFPTLPIITLLMVLPFVANPKNNSCMHRVPMFQVVLQGSDDIASRAIELLKETFTSLGPKLRATQVTTCSMT